MYGISQNDLIMIPPLLWHVLFLLLGTHLGEMFVNRISKGAHMEQSVGTSLETGNKNNKQKTDYQEDRVSYKVKSA